MYDGLQCTTDFNTTQSILIPTAVFVSHINNHLLSPRFPLDTHSRRILPHHIHTAFKLSSLLKTYILSTVQYPVRVFQFTMNPKMASNDSHKPHTPEFEQWVCIICNKAISHDQPPVLNLDNCNCPTTANSSIGTDLEADLNASSIAPSLEIRQYPAQNTSCQNPNPSIMSALSAQGSSGFLQIASLSFYARSEGSTANLPLTLYRYLSSQTKDDPAMLAIPDTGTLLQQGVFEVMASMCATDKGSLDSSMVSNMVSSRNSARVLGINEQIAGVGEWAGEEAWPQRIEKFEENWEVV